MFWKKRPEVTILLRTRSRPSFLPRAIESVLAQSHTDWELLVLDDNAETQTTAGILERYSERMRGRCRHLLVQRSDGRGLGHLLNAGLKASTGRFVAIHDDDDTWTPAFLSRTIEKIGDRMAVVTQSTLVTEAFTNDAIQEHGRSLYNAWQKHAISLFRLAEGMTFPTISLLFRRDALKKIGDFDELLSHKEDWEFVLRLFAQFPVLFLEEPLANFHYRTGDYVPGPGNLVLDHGDHYAAETEVRNKFLREDLAAGRAGMGYLTNLASSRGVLFKEIHSVGHVIENVVLPQLRDSVSPKSPTSRPNGRPMDVVFSADENFAFPLTVALRSTVENHAGTRPLRLHIVDAGISPESRARIEASVPMETGKVTLQWHQPRWERVAHFRNPRRFSPANYGRLLLPELLPSEVEYALYLDADTLVLSDLAEVFDSDCSEKAALAVQDLAGWFHNPAVGVERPERFGVDRESKYFNSGVLLLNLTHWRRHGLAERIFQLIDENPDLLQFADQSPINLALYSQIGELDFAWNFQLADRNLREGSWQLPSAAVPNTRPKILHFVSVEKPWLPGCERPYRNIYREFAGRTAWPLPEALC